MLDPDEALELLKDGNRRFLNDQPTGPDSMLGHDRRLELARSQYPFAVLVSCSDSRVPPELLFGRGLGQLFIVRNAGNSVDTIALGSIEYAVHVLGVRLIVVMGHQRCGAVSTAVNVVETNAKLPGSLGQMVEPIIPAVLHAKATCPRSHDPEQLLDAAVRENIRRVAASLRASEPVILEPLMAGTLKIVGAYYSLDDGRVEFMID